MRACELADGQLFGCVMRGLLVMLVVALAKVPVREVAAPGSCSSCGLLGPARAGNRVRGVLIAPQVVMLHVTVRPP